VTIRSGAGGLLERGGPEAGALLGVSGRRGVRGGVGGRGLWCRWARVLGALCPAQQGGRMLEEQGCPVWQGRGAAMPPAMMGKVMGSPERAGLARRGPRGPPAWSRRAACSHLLRQRGHRPRGAPSPRRSPRSAAPGEGLHTQPWEPQQPAAPPPADPAPPGSPRAEKPYLPRVWGGRWEGKSRPLSRWSLLQAKAVV